MSGIQRIKQAIEKIVEFQVALVKALEDKKINMISEGIPLLFKLWGFVPIVKDAKELYAELKDLDETEKAELVAYFANKFDLPSDEVEQKIEASFKAFVELLDASFGWVPESGD